MKVGLLNGNGYVPGLNAVIYGILLKAPESGIICIGIKKGWRGLLM
jgi:6-phosphofructokinase